MVLMLSACGSLPTIGVEAQVAIDGQGVYERECLACHMADGGGVPGIAPPLVGSSWVNGGQDALIGYVLTGGFGPDVLMSRFDYLTDREIASLLTYIRQVFGSESNPIFFNQVALVRSDVEKNHGSSDPK